jgi:acetyl-CoA carboxylase biotin carboxyl carrier protein
MNLKELKEIIDLVTSKESIEELEIEKAGVRLRIRRASSHAVGISTTQAVAAAAALAAPLSSSAILPGPIAEPEEDLFYVKSPIVGTFYKASSPTEDPFVSIGDRVEKSTVVCIIEAMKLMNEIVADVAGEVVSILVENGQPVEYGEKLFAVRKR